MKLKIAIDSKSYEVDVEVLEEDRGMTPAVRPASSPPSPPPLAASPPPAVGASDEKTCRSPVAGLVVRVLAKPSQAVKANEPLLVLEAMKMESNITAPTDAIVARVLVAPGDSVKTGQALVAFE